MPDPYEHPLEKTGLIALAVILLVVALLRGGWL